MARRVKYDWFYDQSNDVYGDDATVNWELRGYDGHDKLFGNDGNDLLLGGAGNDKLWGDRGDDILRGGEGNDTLYIDRGNNTYDGGSGIDYVDFSRVTTFNAGGWWSHEIEASNVGFSVDIRTGETRAQVSTINGPSAGYTDFWGTNTFENIQTLIMTPHDDVVRDNNAGHTHMLGSGDDLIEGRGGADQIYGQGGSDTASYEGSASGVIVSLFEHDGHGGDAEGDLLFQVENLRGSGHRDRLTGDDEANRIDGGGGDDTILGGLRADTLIGGAGDDSFQFQASSESTVGLSGRDTILDFQRGSDHVWLDFDARTGTPTDDMFSFVGSRAFSGSAGELRSVAVEDSAGILFNRVEGDTNGDARADFAMAVYTNGAALTSGDFFL